MVPPGQIYFILKTETFPIFCDFEFLPFHIPNSSLLLYYRIKSAKRLLELESLQSHTLLAWIVVATRALTSPVRLRGCVSSC